MAFGIVVLLCALSSGRLLGPKPKGYEPKHGDWMHDYTSDDFANCLLQRKCKNTYDPVCAGTVTYDNLCAAKCRNAPDAVKGECGGCLEPNMCCQSQKGGVTKEIEWERGEVKLHQVCVPSGGRRCAKDRQCAHPSTADVVAQPLDPRSAVTVIKPHDQKPEKNKHKPEKKK
eukprot:GEMP01040009.1.p1 GENE.GEMP01040009.1~~GEMP01040009.1.p1  ORF type:complete len:199 (+),score=39.83 GEMP01040009.1:83-598(+)